VLAAQLGGWLGVLLLGRLFATADALWVAVLIVALGPWLIERWRMRTRRVAQHG